VIFIPNEKRYHGPGFGAVPLFAGIRENVRGKTVPFAHMSDYLFHGDQPFQVLTRSQNSVFGEMVIPKDPPLSCAEMKLFPVATAYSIGNEIPVKSSCCLLSP